MGKMEELHKLIDSFEKRKPDEYFKKLEMIRQKFISSFSKEKIENMTLDEYIMGKQSKTSFCYRMEVELKELGGIRGGSASKFGIFYNKASTSIKCTKRYEGENFGLLKEDILSLLKFGEKKDYESIKKSPISPMFKGKILAIYFPEDYQYLFSEDHLDEFIDWFGIDPFTFSDLLEKQLYIGGLKREDSLISMFSNMKYMHFLEYALHNDSKYADSKIEQENDFETQEQMLDEKTLNFVMNKVKDAKSKEVTNIKNVPKIPNKKIIINSKEHFSRNPIVVERVLRTANFQCEIDRKHKTFISNRTGKNFVEAHHLIPMSEQDYFEYSLDIESNIVPLCPNCHRKIHLGTKEDKNNILAELLTTKRISYLSSCGINISLIELEEMYK